MSANEILDLELRMNDLNRSLKLVCIILFFNMVFSLIFVVYCFASITSHLDNPSIHENAVGKINRDITELKVNQSEIKTLLKQLVKESAD